MHHMQVSAPWGGSFMGLCYARLELSIRSRFFVSRVGFIEVLSKNELMHIDAG